MIELKVETLAMDANNQPVVFMRELEGQRALPIWIGLPEAAAISSALEGKTLPRPMTHDLMQHILAELNVQVVKLVITDMRENTYYAELTLQVDTLTKQIDCRPSDGIALSLRTGSPIYISEELFARIEREHQELIRQEKSFQVPGDITIH